MGGAKGSARSSPSWVRTHESNGGHGTLSMNPYRKLLIRHCEGALATEAIQCHLLSKRKSLDCRGRLGSLAMTEVQGHRAVFGETEGFP